MNQELALLYNYLTVGAVLFGIGLVGFLSRRNMILMFLATEMMLQGVSLSLVAWGRLHNDFGAQILVILIITVAACEAAVALALVLVLFGRHESLDILLWQDLREDSVPAYTAEQPPEEPLPKPAFPRLTPAGRQPPPQPEQTDYRPHV